MLHLRKHLIYGVGVASSGDVVWENEVGIGEKLVKCFILKPLTSGRRLRVAATSPKS